MIQLILILLTAGIAAFFFKSASTYDGSESKSEFMPKWAVNAIGGAFAVFSFLLFISLSVVYVGKDELYLMDRIYFGEAMPTGQIIAESNQKGPQADTIPPGFHFKPFVRFIYDLEPVKMITIPVNAYGLVYAKDGSSLREGQVIADAWDNPENMIDATKFIKYGQKGTQLTVLPPAQYRVNTYLFDVEIKNALQVRTGEVAVVRSNVQTADSCPEKGTTSTGINVALVPKGCVGVWDEPIYQGMHYLNDKAFITTKISTRAQIWAYKGGYTKKWIDLIVEDDGSISQSDGSEPIVMPKDAADQAIFVRAEGWTVPVEARITVQVSPENAPKVVAGVGSLEEVENKITTPNTRDSLRTIGGREPSGCDENGKSCKDVGGKVFDFVNKRAEINKRVLEDIKPSTEAAGVTILDFNLGEPAIPPELMVPFQREQLATQLAKTYDTERKAQMERIKSQREKATADQQPELVKAEIDRQASLERMHTRENDGIGERKYLEQLALGEKARKNVLGEENVVMLKALELVAANPQMIKVPHIVVGSQGGSSLEGMAAILGQHSNVAKGLPNAAIK